MVYAKLFIFYIFCSRKKNYVSVYISHEIQNLK